VLWPLTAWGSGEGREHVRVLPFWSQSDSERAHSRSLLWPLIHWSTVERNDRTVDGWFVFPFVGHSASRDGSFSQWTALFPLFQTAEDSRSGDSYTALPWPFYKSDIRPGKSASRWFWPLWGEFLAENEESQFYAWPLVWDQWERSGSGRRRERTFVVPLWMRSETTESDGTTDLALRSWPLFSWAEHAEGTSELRIPQISPVFGWDAGETVYGDLVTLFRWRGDAKGRVAWDGPLGLVRYRRGLDGAARLTLLWWLDIPLGGGS
jgi:hypothetical protein